jgi:hypothetical protein
VEKVKGEKFAGKMNSLFFEISARDGDPTAPFEAMAKKLIENFKG